MLIRRIFHFLPVFLLLAATVTRAAEKPNFIIIFTDDKC